jgi:hypothetical protein
MILHIILEILFQIIASIAKMRQNHATLENPQLEPFF